MAVRWLQKASAVIGGARFAIVLERLNNVRADDIADAVRQNNNLVVAFEQHTLRTIRAADAAVLYLRREYANYGRIATPDELSEMGLLDATLARNFVVTDSE